MTSVKCGSWAEFEILKGRSYSFISCIFIRLQDDIPTQLNKQSIMLLCSVNLTAIGFPAPLRQRAAARPEPSKKGNAP
jgi:hypothetical protein